MLVLSRRKNEKITITTPNEEEITIRVCDCGEGKVKFGIDAPAEFLILRDELKQAS